MFKRKGIDNYIIYMNTFFLLTYLDKAIDIKSQIKQ